MASMAHDQLAEIKAWLAVERAPRDYPSTGPNRNVLPGRWIDWLIAEVEAARKAIDLVKQDGHINPGENCLTCEAVAEYEARHD